MKYLIGYAYYFHILIFGYLCYKGIMNYVLIKYRKFIID